MHHADPPALTDPLRRVHRPAGATPTDVLPKPSGPADRSEQQLQQRVPQEVPRQGSFDMAGALLSIAMLASFFIAMDAVLKFRNAKFLLFERFL